MKLLHAALTLQLAVVANGENNTTNSSSVSTGPGYLYCPGFETNIVDECSEENRCVFGGLCDYTYSNVDSTSSDCMDDNCTYTCGNISINFSTKCDVKCAQEACRFTPANSKAAAGAWSVKAAASMMVGIAASVIFAWN